eukprot:8577156-Ditylum_brightwellii.AAC.1
MAGRPGSSLYVHNSVVGANTSPSTNGNKALRNKTAAIVGASPAGLAAALVLSKVKKARSSKNFDCIVVLEDVVGANTSPSTNVNKALIKKTVVIVGAGLASLAAALILSKVKNDGDLQVIKKTETADQIQTAHHRESLAGSCSAKIGH